MNATEAANPSHDAISKLPPRSPQKRDFTARYVVLMLTGSFQSKCATRLRVAPPITMMLKSDPQPIITTPASHNSTKNANRISLEVAVNSRKVMVVIVEPAAETNTGEIGRASCRERV